MSHTEQEPKGATMTSSVVNTVNTIIGSGMLVLPYAFKTDSIFLGTIILLFAAAANSIGLIIQGMTTKFVHRGTATFFTICTLTYPRLSTLFDIAIFMQCFGVAISYIVLTGDLMPLVFSISDWSETQNRLFYILISTVITVPLCFLHKLDSLRYTSVVSLIAIAYLAILIYAQFGYSLSQNFQNIPPENIGPVFYFTPEGIKPVFKTLGVIVLAYTCPNQYSIVTELQNPTIHRINRIVYLSMGVITAIFFSVSFFGYMTFGNALGGNIILMYGDNIYISLGRLLLVLMVLLSFPLMLYPARSSFNNIYFAFKDYLWHKWHQFNSRETAPLLQNNTASGNLDNTENCEVFAEDKLGEKAVPFPEFRFRWITVVLLVLSYLIAISLDSFELILSVVGATGGVLISYVLPGCYGYKLLCTEDPHLLKMLDKHGGEDKFSKLFKSTILRKCCIGLIIWGLFSMTICLYSSLFE
ncbi:hypothetical protein HII13_000736 [Brettanomyces bruxellensis]|nr:hypothetical protein HII13_000736 [Brettanomyces bruxellensis]